MLNHLRKYKRILAVIAILLITAAVELIANIHALRGGYDSLDLSEKIEVTEEDGEEKYQIRFKPEDAVYVRQICLSGRFPENTLYRITTKEVNGFDAVETGKYSDKIGTYFSSYYTNLNRKVKSLKITMKKSEGMELTGVTLSNRVEVNKYRILFVCITFILLYLVFFEKRFVKNTEWYFAIFALAFGILLITFAQPVCNSWDEQIHFRHAYTIASGRTVQWSQAAQDIAERENFRCNTKEEFAQLRTYMNQNDDKIVSEEKKSSPFISYRYFGNLPTALFLGIGKLLRLPFSVLFAFGKLGNLFLYVFIMFWAIHLAKCKKLFLAFIAMMPTPLFQACSYTYDSVVFSFVTLGCVLWCRETFFGEERINLRAVAAAGCLFVFGCLSKAVYIPVVLLLLLLPQLQKQPKRVKRMLGAGVFLVFALIMLTFVFPIVKNILAGNVTYGGDSRGGDTSAVRQMVSMVKHPWESIRLLIGDICSLDNFRNLGTVESDSYFFGNLMLLNYSAMGTLADKWCVLLLPVLTVLLFHEEPGNERIARCKAGEKALMWGVFAVIVLLIWTALYLSFTPVGASGIAGVQARYYLPLLYLGALLVTNTKVKVQVSPHTLAKMTCLAAWVFQTMALWNFAFLNRIC